MELLSPMAVLLEGLGFNLCVAPFLNICVTNLPQGQRWRFGWRLSELGQRCCIGDGGERTELEGAVRM